MKQLELFVERIILASRWLLVIFYIGLGIALALYAVSFGTKLWNFATHLFTIDEAESILDMLGLIDAALVASLVVMVISAIAYVAAPVAYLCYIPIFVFYFFFGVSYPTLLGIFSGSVGKADQGWIMGVTTAVFTLAGGIMSLIGGGMMSVDIRLPFYVVIVAAALGLVSIVAAWNRPDIRRLTARPVPPKADAKLV